ncbi:MAG: LysM peptidoglycan-binding domain-containing protein [Desulfobulbaceae bacterium]|nr:LysM peptidoglycan-binding domain-containing protein [Candidatus Kapabacteria bacterium]MBS3999223.1 LysM peptidoglycan-binding domain-containing protein [Desulfobulbaceae bacterium]
MKNIHKGYIIILFVLLTVAEPLGLLCQSKGYPVLIPRGRQSLQKGEIRNDSTNTRIFPDKYSDLDDQKGRSAVHQANNEITTTIEQSRQKYLQALILIQKRDTARAARYFEQALDKLNMISSSPGIDNNNDFTDLAQSIIDDYQNYIKNIDLVDESSSFFIIRDILATEIAEDIEPLEFNTPHIAGGKTAIPAYPTLPKAPTNVVIPLTDHPSVEKAISFLTGKTGGRYFRNWLERSSKWFPMMKRYAREHNMPEEIVYLSMIESGLNPTIVSSASAVGLWQFIRSTGEMYNLNKDKSIFVDDRRDPEKATIAAMRHLKDLYNEFGDWHLAMAAYNCGAGCVSRAIRRTGGTKPDYWDVLERLPRETRGYVPMYIATARMAMNPEAYGIDINSLNFQDEYRYDTFQIEDAISLQSIAHAAGVTLDEIKALNPELMKNCTPPDRLPYTLKIPVGTKDRFAVNFAALTDEEKQPFMTHKVKSKETITKIAKNYGIKSSDIVAMNNLKSTKSKLKTGQELIIPVISSPNTETASIAATASNERSSTNSATHKVKSGESLHSIARQYEMEVGELRKLNNLSLDDDKITIGQILVINSSAQVASNQTPTKVNIEPIKSDGGTNYHKVKSGETLAQIADDYGVSIEQIRKINNIDRHKIYSGQNLKIPANGQIKSSTDNEPSIATSTKPIVHKVSRGETLSTIAAKYRVTENQIKAWNPDEINGSTVFANSKLTIHSSTDAKGSSAAQTKNVKSSPKYYTIKRGDTLGEIARKFGVSVTSLKSINKNIDERSLSIGRKIRIQ